MKPKPLANELVRVMTAQSLGARSLASLLATLAAALSSGAVAAPGDLDPSFGRGGRVSLEQLAESSVAYSAVQQADGKLVLVTSMFSDGPHLVLARLEVNGTLDSTFGSNGIAIGRQPHESAEAVIQRGGRQASSSAGTAWSDGYDAVLWRFDADGAADPNFGAGGAARLDLGASENASALFQQTDGKLVLAGLVEESGKPELALLARLRRHRPPRRDFRLQVVS